MNADKNDQKKLIRTSYSKDISVDFDNKNIGRQKFTLESLEDYNDEISHSRTFCTFDEIVELKKMGLIIGGNLNNAIIYTDDNLSIKKSLTAIPSVASKISTS